MGKPLSRRTALVALYFVAYVFDIATEAFGGLAAGASEGDESHGKYKQNEVFQ